MIRVAHVQRRPIVGFNFSVERLFETMREEMPADIDVRVHQARFHSRGLWRRVVTVMDAARQRADVVHVTGDIHFVVLGLRRRRTVLTVLDCRNPGSPAKRAIYRALWLRGPIRRAARVAAISDFTAGEVAQVAGIPIESVAVIPVPISDAFVPVPAPENPRPVLLCIGTAANKNLDRVVEAVAGLDVELRIVGRLPEATELLLRATGTRYTNGYNLSDDELLAWYAASDIVVFPSLYEGFGMPIVEAQAVGRPVITSARAPMEEVAGGAACLVDPEDVRSIRNGIVHVLEDATYRDELVAKGLQNRERFRPQAAAEKYAVIYREMVK